MDESRKQFEWWFSDQGRHLYAVETSNGDYLLASAESSWQAWQASRAAIEIELPSLKQIDTGERYVWSDGVFNFKLDAIEAIRAAGIKVRE